MADTSGIRPGDRIGGYQILAPVGAGSMGAVFRARQLSLGREVALKVFTFLAPGLEDDAARFLREGRIQARLNHPHLVKVHDHGEEGSWLFIAMELIEGRSLEAVLAAEPRMGAKRATALLRDVADALEYLHRSGVQHRDIKPANILLDGSDKPFLADFGLARSRDDTLLTRDTSLLGTLAYMAPEVIAGGDRDPAADVWSLGVVLHRMLSGDFPHAAATPGEFFDKVTRMDPAPFAPELEVPSSVAELCAAMLRREPGARPTAARVRDKLRAMRHTTTLPRARPTISSSLPAIRDGTPVTSRPWGQAVAGALTVIVLGIAAMAWRGTVPRPPGPALSPRPAALVSPEDVPADDPRAPLLARFRERLASEAPAIRLAGPAPEPRALADWFWAELARLQRIDPASLRGWFLVTDVTVIDELLIRLDGSGLEKPPDRGAMNRALLRVNGTAVSLDVGSASTWSVRVPRDALRPGINHWSLTPDPGLRDPQRVRLERHPAGAPPRRPRPPRAPAPSREFRDAETACIHKIYAGVFLEARECYAPLAARHPDKPWALWQLPFTDICIARGVRDLDQAIDLPTGHSLLPGNVRGPEEAGKLAAASVGDLGRSLALDPGYGLTWRILGELLHTVGEPEMAWSALMYGCVARPDDAHVWMGPASVYGSDVTRPPALRARRTEAEQAARAAIALGRDAYGEPVPPRQLQGMKDLLRQIELEAARSAPHAASAPPSPATR